MEYLRQCRRCRKIGIKAKGGGVNVYGRDLFNIYALAVMILGQGRQSRGSVEDMRSSRSFTERISEHTENICAGLVGLVNSRPHTTMLADVLPCKLEGLFKVSSR